MGREVLLHHFMYFDSHFTYLLASMTRGQFYLNAGKNVKVFW